MRVLQALVRSPAQQVIAGPWFRENRGGSLDMALGEKRARIRKRDAVGHPFFQFIG